MSKIFSSRDDIEYDINFQYSISLNHLRSSKKKKERRVTIENLSTGVFHLFFSKAIDTSKMKKMNS